MLVGYLAVEAGLFAQSSLNIPPNFVFVQTDDLFLFPLSKECIKTTVFM